MKKTSLYRRHLLLCLLLATTVLARSAQAADEEPRSESDIPDSCLTQVMDAMGQVDREYRSVVVGLPKAELAPVGSLRYDKQGRAWTKTDKSEWKSLTMNSDGQAPSAKSNGDMEYSAELPSRRGWLEVKQASTSELIPPLLQSMRALQCRVRSVCDRAAGSFAKKTGETIESIQPIGCLEQKNVPVIDGCTVPDRLGNGNAETIRSQCAILQDKLVFREAQLLKLLVAYDAAQRSAMQFAGIIDTFLKEFRFPLLQPIWQAVQSFTALGRIPCFSAQCDQ